MERFLEVCFGPLRWMLILGLVMLVRLSTFLNDWPLLLLLCSFAALCAVVYAATFGFSLLLRWLVTTHPHRLKTDI